MKLNFCTLFNSFYLTRGLVLYESLREVCKDFHLYVFAFDNKTYDYLTSLELPDLTVISLAEFEDQKLLTVKNSRTAAEYCWTCTPSTILYVLKNYNADHCTYIDADMRFYSNPVVLLNEMNGKSVLITEHRYTKHHDQTEKSGKYCVQFITAYNNTEGLEVMEWWRNACIDWCYARQEDGKFGDQKYLDDWTTRFNSVHELENLGGGIAPWNVQQYAFGSQNGKIIGKEFSSRKQFEVVFFHYHGLKFFDNDIVLFTEPGYELNEEVRKLFYIPYVRKLMQAKQKVNRTDSSFNPNGSGGPSPVAVSKFKAFFQYYFSGIRSSKRNIFGLQVLRKLKVHYFFNAGRF